jgi:F-box and leucine-rich repeat protein GRR1
MARGPDDDDDQTMTGMVGATAMMSATALNADDEDVDPDEELEDVGEGGVSFNHGHT